MSNPINERALGDVSSSANGYEGEERALGDEPQQVEVMDVTRPLNPETFDLAAWVDGARPTRRAVKVYGDTSVVGRMEQLVDAIETAPGDVDVDALIDEYEDLAKLARPVWFTMESRSEAWVAKFREDTSRRLNLEVKVDQRTGAMDGKSDPSKVQRILVEQIAAQILEPAGITADHIARLQETGSDGWSKLVGLLVDVNQRLAETSGVMTRDFSRRRSTRSSTLES